MSTSHPLPTLFPSAASQTGRSWALVIGKLLETPMDLTFDPVSAAWDTFKFWDNHETSTDNPFCHLSGICRGSRYRSDGEPYRREKGPGPSSYSPAGPHQRPFR